jgi:hypothetical protein
MYQLTNMNAVEVEPESPGRHPAEIAIKILQLIPESETVFRNDMTQFIRDLSYKAPEMLIHLSTWLEFDSIMHRHIRDLLDVNTVWKQSAIDIYTGKTK